MADFEAGIKHLRFRKELLLHINGPRRRSKEFKVITVWVNGYWLIFTIILTNGYFTVNVEIQEKEPTERS